MVVGTRAGAGCSGPRSFVVSQMGKARQLPCDPALPHLATSWWRNRSQTLPSRRDFSKSNATPSPRGNISQGQVMGQVKKAVLDLVKKLPADCTLEDVQYQLYVRQKVERSMQAAAAGRVTSHEQVKKRLSKWLAQ
jgi:hypothetical protein